MQPASLFFLKSDGFDTPFDDNIRVGSFEISEALTKFNIPRPISCTHIGTMIDAEDIKSDSDEAHTIQEALKTINKTPCIIVFYEDKVHVMYPDYFYKNSSEADGEDNETCSTVIIESVPNDTKAISKDDITNLKIGLHEINSVDDFLAKFV